MSLSKPVMVKDPKYGPWLADHYDCIMCGKKSGPPHHIPNPYGQTRRSRDDFQVPLDFGCHRFLHDHPFEEAKRIGWLQGEAEKFWKEYQESKR